MIIPLTEPSAPRYIYINPETNQVHLLVPVVGGQTISTDNTCKTTLASDEFFSAAALRELNAYKAALEFDLQFLSNDNVELSTSKQQRLAQINAYIAAIPAIQTIGGGYKNAITALKEIPSNLYSIQLRPREQDSVSNIVNPMFTINRTNDGTGNPLSALYNALHTAFPNAAIAPLNPRQRLETAVMAELVAQPVNVETTQRVLTEQCHRLFGLTVDFTHDNLGAAVNQASLDTLMGFTPDSPATTEDYMNALLGACALNIWDNIATSPFYSGHDNPTTQTEKLSIMTQFFLAHVNIHCAENTISPANFGAILDDASSDLSDEVAGIVVSALKTGADVEESLCTFFNEHLAEFGFIRALSPADTGAIKQRFISNYATVKDLKEMDEFMILNTATDTGNFVTHQGAICTDFSELAVNNPLDNAFFQAMRADFEAPKGRYIPHRNEHITASIDVGIEELLSRTTDDEQLKLLDVRTRHQLNMSPIFQSRLFLHCVAKGQQDEAQRQIEANPALLLTTGRFTDYSGRTFNCSAYEYAYWAKDTHMCRMLERDMDENTKAAMLQKVIAIDSVGLTYEQHGQVKNSTHFDMTPLITALQNYVNGYDAWAAAMNYDARRAAWMIVGLAQRDLPVHVINEYCQEDRSFGPLPAFNEDQLPRNLLYYNFITDSYAPLFPLVVSGSSGLGVDFSLLRGASVDIGAFGPGVGPPMGTTALLDLAAASRLDEVRTADLTLSRTNLGLIEPELDHGARRSL